MQIKKYAPLLIVLAGACWGGIGVFVRILSAVGFTSFDIVELRAIVTLILFALVVALVDPKLFRIKLRHLWCFLGMGLIGLVFFNLCYFTTIQIASLSVAAVLLYTAPIFVMLFSAVLFKEPITRRKLLCLLMAFIGCMFVSGIFEETPTLTPKGFLIGICAGLGYGLFTIFSRYAINYGYHPLTMQFYNFLTGAICGALLTDFHHVGKIFATEGSSLLLPVIAVGLLCTALPNLLYNFGLQYVDNGKTSIMGAMEPVMAIIFGVVLYHEIPTPLAAIGMLLCLLAIVLINGGDKQVPTDTKPTT